MTIEAKVIADSVSAFDGARITTLQLRLPRMVHSELLTHRAFSRNSSSSRAIPVERLIEDVLRDPAMPVYWGKNQKGMQAREELDEASKRQAESLWLHARQKAVASARDLHAMGLHKQIVNRVLEPFSHINVVVTATEWKNFFELRCHPDAQPEIRVLAEAMRDAMHGSEPVRLQPGEWHLPYVSEDETENYQVDQAFYIGRKLSVARCARVSYLTHEGEKPSLDSDLNLYKRLVGSRPMHASPAEHQATPSVQADEPAYRSNFKGWIQFRKLLEMT